MRFCHASGAPQERLLHGLGATQAHTGGSHAMHVLCIEARVREAVIARHTPVPVVPTPRSAIRASTKSGVCLVAISSRAGSTHTVHCTVHCRMRRGGVGGPNKSLGASRQGKRGLARGTGVAWHVVRLASECMVGRQLGRFAGAVVAHLTQKWRWWRCGCRATLLMPRSDVDGLYGLTEQRRSNGLKGVEGPE